jgi:hypothetical protein
MVMLRMIYDASPHLLEKLLKALCAQELTIGPRFSQQGAESHSVPDGLILQEPLAVFVETKLGETANADQLRRHCQSITARLANRKGSFLISLTAGQPGQALPLQVTEMASQHNITVVPTTFGELVAQLPQLPDTDLTLRETFDEFTQFIEAQGLVPRREQQMVAMLTRTSWRDNLKWGVYYEPSYRNPKQKKAAFLGLYHDKQVSHVGRIVVAACAIKDETGNLVFEDVELGNLTDEHRKAVESAILAGQAYYPDFERSAHRYYIVDAFTPTDFQKTSPGGMMGHGYFDIEEFSGQRLLPSASGSSAAAALSGKNFK